MGEVAFEQATRDVAPAHGERIALGPGAVGWLVALPCMALTALVVLALGPPLSGVVVPPPHLAFLPGEAASVTPEPLEDTRYLLALVGPLLLAGAIATSGRLRLALPPRWTAAGVALAQVVVLALVFACFRAQNQTRWGVSYFNPRTLAVAAAIAAALALAARSRRMRAVAAVVLRDTLPLRLALLAVAAVATAIWLLPAINTEASIRWSFLEHDTQFHLDETFAVLNGLTPLADFNAQYASLMPYLIALAMRAFEPTLLVFTITVCALSLLALLAVFGVLRRASRSAVAAFVLFVPFMATSLFIIGGIPVIRFTPAVYFPMFPLRYGGAYLLAWLVARHLERAPRMVWPLFLAAGLTVLNNFEFGVAALGGTVGALLVTMGRVSWERLLRLAGAAALGLGGAVALYSVVTLARAGSLPHLGRLAEFARLYGAAGFSVLPLPGVVGLPLVIYGTYAAAIGLATVRARRAEPNRVLTGMLMWVGLFGLGSATYYVARSSVPALGMLFSAWALALALLTIAAMQRLAAPAARVPSLAAIAVLFGFGLTACSLAQLPSPSQQIERVRTRPANIALLPENWTPPSQDPQGRFIGSLADGLRRFVFKRGAPVALFTTMGHRLADRYGVVDVVPYTGPESIHTREQLNDALDALRRAGGNTALVPTEQLAKLRPELIERGFALVTRDGLRPQTPADEELPFEAIVVDRFTKWVDTRQLRAPALG
jgi:hypothetical protein